MGLFSLTRNTLSATLLAKGGKGSGFFGHDGRPGEKGGSAEAGQSQIAFSDYMKSGGASVAWLGSRPTTGYMVSPYKDRERIVSIHVGRALVAAAVKGFRDQNRDLLAKPGHILGMWRNGDKVYLDVSLNIRDLAEAKGVGRGAKQLKIWDVANKKEMDT